MELAFQPRMPGSRRRGLFEGSDRKVISADDLLHSLLTCVKQWQGGHSIGGEAESCRTLIDLASDYLSRESRECSDRSAQLSTP